MRPWNIHRNGRVMTSMSTTNGLAGLAAISLSRKRKPIKSLRMPKANWIRLLTRRPGDFGRAGEAVLFLHKDASMGGPAAARLIHQCDSHIVGRQRFKDQLSTYAMPDFDDVMQHGFVFFITWAQWNIKP